MTLPDQNLTAKEDALDTGEKIKQSRGLNFMKMKRIFSAARARKNSVSNVEEASNDVEKKIQSLNTQIMECNKELFELKKLMETSRGVSYVQAKDRAIIALQRKQMYEAQLSKYRDTQLNLDSVKIINSSLNTNLITIKALEDTSSALQHVNNTNSMESNDITEELDDLSFFSNEISDILKSSGGYEVNETEIQAEFDLLMQKDAEMSTSGVPKPSENILEAIRKIPSVSNNSLSNQNFYAGNSP